MPEMKFHCLILWLLLPIATIAQDTSEVSRVLFYSSREGAVVYLDTMQVTLNTGTYDTIFKGTYILSGTAQYSKPYLDTILIAKDLEMIKVSFSWTDDYVLYRKKKFQYRLTQIVGAIALPTVIYIDWRAYKGYQDNRKLYDNRLEEMRGQILQAKEKYENTVSLKELTKQKTLFESGMAAYKEQIRQYNNYLKRSKRKLILHSVYTVGAVALFSYAILQKKPIISDTGVHSRLIISPTQFSPNETGIQLTYRF